MAETLEHYRTIPSLHDHVIHPIGDNRTAKGRDQNNRVEMIFLHQ